MFGKPLFSFYFFLGTKRQLFKLVRHIDNCTTHDINELNQIISILLHSSNVDLNILDWKESEYTIGKLAYQNPQYYTIGGLVN